MSRGEDIHEILQCGPDPSAVGKNQAPSDTQSWGPEGEMTAMAETNSLEEPGRWGNQTSELSKLFRQQQRLSWASLAARTVKNPPARRETWVPSLGWEDPLEEGTATHSNILAWRIPWTEEPGRLQSMGSQSWIQLND